jgi:hypothetical protein
VTTPERVEGPVGGKLRPYFCAGSNPYTGRPCRTVLIQAWSPAGAVVRRRCKRCGAWATIVVAPDPPGSDAESPVLD